MQSGGFFRWHFEQRTGSLLHLLFVWHTVFIEQCSAINRLSMASTSTNFLSLVFATQNFALFAFGRTQNVLWPCLGAFCYKYAFKVHMFRYDLYSIIAKFATGFSWISRINTEPNIKYWILQPHLPVKNFDNVTLVHQGVFFIRYYYLLA